MTKTPQALAPVRRALISVTDKAGLAERAARLAAHGVEILSTGGTRRVLEAAGVEVTDVADVTGFPEIMDGRVKTLHPKVHGGLLARRDEKDHLAAAERQNIPLIDLLVVNLYAFEATLASGADFEICVENIDVGGPAMIRAAAKNHAFVTVCVDSNDLDSVLAELDAHKGATTLALRQRLAAKAFARTAAYDAAIAGWLGDEVGERFPRHVAFGGERGEHLRYGENPHQAAAFYRLPAPRPGVATARHALGPELSYNNLADADGAFELVAEFDAAESAAVAIIKHANPCGAALGESLAEAYEKALACDPVSAFGGVVAANRPLNEAIAEAIARLRTDVVIAPGADEAALAYLGKRKNTRVRLVDAMPSPTEPGLTIKTLAGGFLVQERDAGRVGPADWKVVTKRAPTEAEAADLMFAWRVAKHVKSNAIVFAKELSTAGVGAGQMSRVDSARIAALKAKDAAQAAGWKEPRTVGSACASDAFFPFADGLLQAAEAGATAVIQPGGAMRDEEVIAAADDAGLAMVFTGVRHFRH
jgi:phosphoribosylaminoimidazolecarboxamide formyltransferase/IMP cyclohydrolase